MLINLSGRQRCILSLLFSLFILIGVVIFYYSADNSLLNTDLSNRKLPPSLLHFFGTDWLGRDMWIRTLKGLYLSINIGFIACFFSIGIAFVIGVVSAIGGNIIDTVLGVIIDLFISIPHIVLLILISFAFGGGEKGVIIAIALSHWPRIALLIRAEINTLKNENYINISKKFGKSKLWIVWFHMLPHIFPQLLIGFILLFPHAILHEAGLTFLGFGLSPHKPAIGIILSESMRHLSTGLWWLAVFPGVSLIFILKIIDNIGSNVRVLISPKTSQL